VIDITSTTVTLMVEDLDRAQAFWTDALGFGLEYRAGPHFAMLSRSGLRVGLHPRGDNPVAGDARGISFGLQVPDIEVAMQALESAGVGFPGGLVDDGPIRRADFTDPDGTALYLVQTGASA